MRLHALAVLVVLNAAVTTQANAQRPNAGPLEIPVGSPMIDASLIRPASLERRFIRVSGGSEQVVGTLTQSISRIVVNGKNAIQSITTVKTGRGTGADSAVFSAADLAPIWHRSTNPGRTMHLAFEGSHVTGSVTPAGGTVQPVNHTTPIPTFDSSMLDLIIAALPLKAGFEARIPIYIFESDGLVWLDVKVASESDILVAGRTIPVFEVDTHTPKGDTRYSISRLDREVVRTSFRAPDGTELRFER
jgi:hypothetical protein